MISIIVPIYNIEDYIRKSIESLIAQRSNDIEIILVDDGSVDSCPSICDEYYTVDKRVVVIHKKNGGLVSARIAGLEVAKGEYIMFVDGDDWIEGELIGSLEHSLTNNKDTDLICFGSIYINTKSRLEHRIALPSGTYNRKKIEDTIFPNLIENAYGKYFDSSIWGKVFRKSLLEECYDRMNTDITMGEDGAITRPYMLKCNQITIIEKCFYCYNRTNQSSMTSALKPINWKNPWLIRDVLIKSFGYTDKWKYQINRNTVHNLFITSISQFNSSKSFFKVSRDIRKNLYNGQLKDICDNTHYSKILNRTVVFIIKHRITIAMFMYWRSLSLHG